MQDKLYQIELTLKELSLLDNNVGEKAQSIIDTAKRECQYGFELDVMNEVLRKSEELGTFSWSYKEIKSCKYCDKKYDYYTYDRNSRYHCKGEKNYDKPKYYSGIKFNEGFVSISGLGDMCLGCEKEHDVIHRLIDYIIDNDLKIEIKKNDYRKTKYLKDKIEICYECGSEMRQSEMGSLRTLMGNGFYKGKCPYCGAESIPFGKNHKPTNKFNFILNPEFVK